MATYSFGSYSDIEAYTKDNFNVGLIILEEDKTTKEIIQQEQKRLLKILKEEVAKYYRSYNPITYQRTYDMMKAITLSPIKVGSDGSFFASIYFNDKAYKPSVINPSKYEDGFTPILINNGWSWRNQPQQPIEHFTYQEPFNFGEKAVARYNKENPYGFVVELEIEYTGSR